MKKSDDIEDIILKEMAEAMRDIEIVEGCRTCMHQIINCRNHTHCSSFGHELICDCSVCGGTGKPKRNLTAEEHVKQDIEARGKYQQNMAIPFTREEVHHLLFHTPDKEVDKDMLIVVLLRYLEFNNKSDYDFVKGLIDG